MASILFGLVVVDARGKLGGHVFTKVRSGNTLRTKSMPTNPRTPRQQTMRAALGTLSSNWRALTASQRLTWINSVNNFVRTNVFGVAYAPSGKNLYVSLNQNLANVGASPIVDAPIPQSVIAPNVSEMAITLSGSSIEFTFDTGAAGQSLLISATRPVSPGKYYMDNEFRIVDTYDQTTASAVNIWAAYVAIFGIPTLEQKIFLKVVPVNETSGQTGVIEMTNALVEV